MSHEPSRAVRAGSDYVTQDVLLKVHRLYISSHKWFTLKALILRNGGPH